MTSMMIKRVLLFAGILAVLVTAGCYDDPCCTSSGDYEVTELFDHEVALAEHDMFRLVAVNGPIVIICDDSVTTVEISGEISVCADGQDQAESLLAETEVRITETGSRVLVQTIHPDDDNCDITIDYEVRIPRSWAISVQHVNGTVSVSNCENSVDVSLVNGDTNLTGLSGNLSVQVVNGGVVASVTPPAAGTCQIDLVNGSITLSLPQSVSALFSATVTNGTIQVSGFQMSDWVATLTSASGTLGDGDGTITLHTTNGTIVVDSD